MRYLMGILLSAMFCGVVHASDFYTDAGITANIIEVAETKYKPVTVRAKVGYLLTPKVSVETHISTHVYEDEKEGQRYEVRNLNSLFLRYGTEVKRRFRAYLLAGYTYVNLDITNSSGNFFQEHKDFSYAFGLEENLKTFRDVSFTLEYARYIDDDENKFIMSGISMGFRAAF